MDHFKKYHRELTTVVFDFADECNKKLSLCQYFFTTVPYSDSLKKLQRAAYRDIIVSPVQDQIFNSLKQTERILETSLKDLAYLDENDKICVTSDISVFHKTLYDFDVYNEEVASAYDEQVVDEFVKLLIMKIESVRDLLQIISPSETKYAKKELAQDKHLLIDDSKISLIINDLTGYLSADDLGKIEHCFRGDKVSKICFFSNANKLTEYFRRLRYNNVINNSDTDISHFIVSNFTYSTGSEPKKFDFKNVYKVINTGIGEPTRSRRIDSHFLEYIKPEKIKALKKIE